MKALVHTKPFNMEYKNVPNPRNKDDEIIIKVAAVGICGSDVHGFTGKTGRRIPPLIMGHEAAGEIVELNNKSKFNIGDRVTFDSTIYCGTCEYCLANQVNLCSDRRVLGVSCDEYLQNGAMSEYISIPERIVYKLEDNINYNDAALIEPASVAYHAVSLSKVTISDTIMVIGAGVIGLIIIQALKIYGCENIISVDVDTNRLEVAKYYGATILINSRENDVKRIIKNNYLEEIDLAFEAVGIDETVNLSIESVKKNGRIVLVGNVMPNVRIPLQKIVTRELKITGSCAIAGEYPLVIKDLSEKKLDFEKIITSTARLIDGKDWFEKLHSGSHNEIKVILNP